MDSLAFLDQSSQGSPQPVYVLHGDEAFLKRQVVEKLRSWIQGEDGSDFNFSSFAGDKAVWSTVHDEVATLAMFGGRRCVLIDNADPFVTKYRTQIEKYVGAPSPSGVLVLEVKSLPSNTRLAKLLPAEGNIECKTPSGQRLPQWCVRRCTSEYGKGIVPAAAQLLVQLIGPEMGLLDQELAKLSTYAGQKPRVEAADVDRLVGNSRAEDVWKIFEAISTGQIANALAILDRLFDQGNDPHAVLGAFSYQIRQLARAGRLYIQGGSLKSAMEGAGIKSGWQAERAEAQMRHLGRRRLVQLYDWLLEVDLGLKGGSALPPRLLLERLVVRLARKSA